MAKRITSRAVAAGEEAALAAELGGALRVGTLQGVHIDFRHPDLPQGEWEALPWWYVWGRPPVWSGLLFPSEASFGLKRLRASKHLDDLKAIYARPGDRITIERVEVDASDNCFDHPHDRERRLAFLRLERPTGEIFEAGPLAFFGVARVVGHGSREAFDHVIERILAHAKVDDLPTHMPKDTGDYWGRPIEYAALEFGREAHRSYFELRKGLDARQAALLRMLTNSATLAGFLLAKMEAREAERFGAGAKRGAEAGAASVTRVDWREKAKTVWAEHPNWTLYAVAKAVRAGSDDSQQSVERGIGPLCPATSPSYEKLKARGIVA